MLERAFARHCTAHSSLDRFFLDDRRLAELTLAFGAELRITRRRRAGAVDGSLFGASLSGYRPADALARDTGNVAESTRSGRANGRTPFLGDHILADGEKIGSDRLRCRGLHATVRAEKILVHPLGVDKTLSDHALLREKVLRGRERACRPTGVTSTSSTAAVPERE